MFLFKFYLSVWKENNIPFWLLFLNVKILPRNKILEKSDYSFFSPILFLLSNFINISSEVAFFVYKKPPPKEDLKYFSCQKFKTDDLFCVLFFKNTCFQHFFKTGHCWPSIHKSSYPSLIWNSLLHYFMLQC